MWGGGGWVAMSIGRVRKKVSYSGAKEAEGFGANLQAKRGLQLQSRAAGYEVRKKTDSVSPDVMCEGYPTP